MRYEIAPHYDLWMRGDRYGSEVKRTRVTHPGVNHGREIIHLRMEITGKVHKFWADEVTPK